MNNAFIDDTFDNTEEEIVLDPPTELFEEANTIAQNNENDEKFEFILEYDVNQKDFLLSLLEALGINPSEIHENEDMTISINLNMSQLAFIKKMDFIEEVHSTIISNPYIFLEAEAASAKDSTTVEIDHINEETLIPSPESIENLNIETVPLITPTIDTTLTEDEVANNEVATMSVNNSRCSSCISNSTMETAKQIITESLIIGCICCPENEEWFKFTAPETRTYSIYTIGTLDTVGAIYDSSGTVIDDNDDYFDEGNLNFRIICDLTAGETYYVKVRLNKKATGKYTFRVTKKILAKEVNINQPAISLMKGVTYELPTRPNYVYKGYNGAVPIPDFSVSIYPADTTEQLIYWYEEPFNNTVTCTVDRDDDGDLYYHLTALEIGTTKLYARDWNDNGTKDECLVIVETKNYYSERNKIVNTGDGSNLNVRATPDITGTLIGKFADQSNIHLINSTPTNGYWYYVYGQEINGTYMYGWCSGEYLGKYIEYGTLVDVNTLNVRSGAGTGYTSLGTINKGNTVEIIEKNCATGSGHTWHKILYNGSIGYVAAGNNTPNFTFETRWVALTTTINNNENIDISKLTPISGNRYLSQAEMENNALIIYDYLRNKINTPWSKNAICALLGNMEAESTINPERWQNGVGPGYGLVQWDPASKWLEWAAANNYTASSLFGQLHKILNEVENDGIGVWNDSIHQWQKFRVDPEISFKNFTQSNKSVNDLSTIFLKCYERPKDQSASVISYRENLCTNWLNYINSFNLE